jgi:hypothetical protein
MNTNKGTGIPTEGHSILEQSPLTDLFFGWGEGVREGRIITNVCVCLSLTTLIDNYEILTTQVHIKRCKLQKPVQTLSLLAYSLFD